MAARGRVDGSRDHAGPVPAGRLRGLESLPATFVFVGDGNPASPGRSGQTRARMVRDPNSLTLILSASICDTQNTWPAFLSAQSRCDGRAL